MSRPRTTSPASSSGTEPRTIPSQDRARDTVNELLDATEEVARRVGFEEATTKEIAIVAGVSPGTLYRYFPSKEALLTALVRRKWDAGVKEFGEGIALVRPGNFESVVDEIVRLAFTMIAGRIEAFGKMGIETNNIVQVGADLVNGAAMLVQGALERRREMLHVEDLQVASIIIVRSVVFLARIAVRDYPELLTSGRYATEVATMIRRYLVNPTATTAASDDKPL